MSIDREKLYLLIANRPKIRTVEIADLMDCEPEQVQPALQPFIDAGDIIMHPVTAPNGKPANGFEFSPAFMGRDLYKLIIKGNQVAPPAAPFVMPPNSVIVRPSPPARPADLRMKSEIATECLELNGGKVTIDQMRTALSLAKNATPSPWLKTVMNRGEIWTDKKFFYLSSVHPAPKVEKPTFPDPVPEAVAGAMVEAVIDDKLPVTMIERRPASELEAPGIDIDVAHTAGTQMQDTDTDFRCALWSNGEIEMRRGADTIAVLALSEWKKMQDFFAHVAVA